MSNYGKRLPFVFHSWLRNSLGFVVGHLQRSWWSVIKPVRWTYSSRYDQKHVEMIIKYQTNKICERKGYKLERYIKQSKLHLYSEYQIISLFCKAIFLKLDLFENLLTLKNWSCTACMVMILSLIFQQTGVGSHFQELYIYFCFLFWKIYTYIKKLLLVMEFIWI